MLTMITGQLSNSFIFPHGKTLGFQNIVVCSKYLYENFGYCSRRLPTGIKYN